MVDNLLSLTSTPLSNRTGWGPLHLGLEVFIHRVQHGFFTPSLGWLYVSPDNSNGFWFWDSTFNAWWWSKPVVFPHFYHNTMGWSYWDLLGNARLYYDYTSKSWVSP